MARAAAVIIMDRKIALIRRQRSAEESAYYLFPGGQVERDESLTETVKRECFEELGCTVDVGRLIARSAKDGIREHYFFEATITGGRFGTGRGIELAGVLDKGKGTYSPVWLDIHELEVSDVRPKSLAAAIARNLSDISDPFIIHD